MTLARGNFVDRFFDLEAREGDRDEEDDNEDDTDGMTVCLLISKFTLLQQLSEGFIQDDPTIDTQYTPQRHSVDVNVDEGRWVDLVESLEERYSSTHHVAQGDRDERRLVSHPIAGTIEQITRLPTNDDYPLWRVRCKVYLTSVISRDGSWYLCLAGHGRRDCIFVI